MTFVPRYQQQGSSSQQQQQPCAYNKTWPKQHCTDEEGRVFPTQDDQQVQYVDVDVIPQQSRPKKKKHRDRSPGQVQSSSHSQQPGHQQSQDYPCFREREYLVSTGSSRHYETQSKAAHDPIPAIEEVGRYIEQAENRAKSVKDIARDLAKDRAVLELADQQQLQQQQQQQHQKSEEHSSKDMNPQINPETIPPPPPNNMESSQQSTAPPHNLQTFNPQASTKPEVQLQQEHIQYIDNECCQVAVGVSSTAGPSAGTNDQVVTTTAASAAAAATTLPRSRPPPQHPAAKSKTGTLSTAQMNAQYGTLERNMAEAAERSRLSRAELARTQTLDRQSRYGDSCDTCDAPLTPASLAGIDHRDLEHRPLTRSVTRATVYDEPPEK